MDKQIYLTARMIATESDFSTGLAFGPTVSKLTALISDVTTEIGNSLSSFKELFDNSTTLFDKRSIAKTIDGFNFMSIAEVEIPVPMGLTKNFPAYLGDMHAAVCVTTTITENVLKPAIAQLAGYVAQPETLLSIRKNEKLFKINDLQGLKENLSRHIDNKAQLSKAPFKQAFQRLGDFEVAGETLNDLNRQMRGVSLKEVNDLTDRAVELFGMLQHNLSSEGKIGISGPTADLLSKAAVALAEEIEFLGGEHRYRLSVRLNLSQLRPLAD